MPINQAETSASQRPAEQPDVDAIYTQIGQSVTVRDAATPPSSQERRFAVLWLQLFANFFEE
jgi:hypothetical protein